MATFDEISQQQARRILKAMRDDSLREGTIFGVRSLQGSRTVAELKRIASELDSEYTVDGRPLTDRDKQVILEGTADHLGVQDKTAVDRAVKHASNDAFMELVGDIGKILNTKKK